ncbi:MAG: hypothetical protein IGS50_06970 [Synechococcales cyanobacterium C42_A2020_086]|nr:hypothetical protein [Synechococcales cyanobacterium C42_A2020_086]
MNGLRPLKLLQFLITGCMIISLALLPGTIFTPAAVADTAPRIIQAERNDLDAATIKRIQERAEDLGDGAERDIGDTGLKNLRKLPENVPETLDLIKRQRFGGETDVPAEKRMANPERQ